MIVGMVSILGHDLINHPASQVLERASDDRRPERHLESSCHAYAQFPALRRGYSYRDHCAAPNGLSIEAAAEILRVSRPALSNLLNGNANLSGEMALRIEKAFGVRMDTLLRMQTSYVIA
jgi:addiction module HigA family antidote